MKKYILLFILPIFALFANSCEELDNLTAGLTNDEIVEGLKSALTVGSDTSVSTLNAVNGYLGDDAVKILLPPEASKLVDNISMVPGLDILVNEAVKSINRAAEDAAIEAKPIFIDAITNITITDGLSILQGKDDAATTYLSSTTSTQLTAAFAPKISTSLNKKLVGNVSAESAYSTLITKYNQASLGGVLFAKIETNTLAEHTTRKALDGLFLKVAGEESKIRNDVGHRVNEILKKVFAEK